MTRIILIVFLTFLIVFGKEENKLKKKYAEKVHQYIIHESYKLLRKEIGADFALPLLSVNSNIKPFWLYPISAYIIPISLNS